MATLIVLAGRPGSGKSSIANGIARKVGAVWLRIDSIEQAIRESGKVPDAAGYLTAYAVARDNLSLGLTVIGDCVNPWTLTRDAWRDAGLSVGAKVVEIEVLCSNRAEHRKRIADRTSDISGPPLPDWEEVLHLDYHPWDRPHTIIDTSGRTVMACIDEALAAL